MNQFPLLTEKELSTLYDNLHYMNISELRKVCELLSLPNNGKKIQLIERILFFIKEGKLKAIPPIPSQSLAQNYPTQPLHQSSLMLHGAYKNNLKTRLFFKKLIGPGFHFTAFGSDWLNERWQQGKPPTYQEFADFWIHETNKRALKKAKPKDEWMLIRFIQKTYKKEPHISQNDLMKAWKKLQAEKAKSIFKIIDKIIN